MPAPAMKVGEEMAIGSQGLRKKLVKEGVGQATPDKGDEVHVYYVGEFLDGTEFDVGRDKGPPYRFTLGHGQVIEGWDQGIKTMKKGEKAVFTVPSELAYGEFGSPPTISPNLTLKYHIELLSWISPNDISKDGGIIKEILEEGEKWEKPKLSDEVLVKYVAKLENDVVVAESDWTEFIVREGHLCPALKKAVVTMTKREKAHLTVKPKYGFGSQGRPASIDQRDVPPNATLHITLHLVSWKTVSDITNDKKVIKKILKEGEGYDRPNDGATVRVKLIGRLHDGTEFFKNGLLEYKINEGQAIEGLDKSVMEMKKGEVASLAIAPEYAFGSSESRQTLAVVPANSTVYFEIELVSFEKVKEIWEMNTVEKIAAASEKKEVGNALFRAGKCARASILYEKAAKYVEYDTSFGNEEKIQSKALKITCNLNNAFCMLKLKEFKQAVKLCTKVLRLESQNVKALYRRAQAYINLMNFAAAEIDFEKALQIEPANRAIKIQYEKLMKLKACNEEDSVLYGNIFAKK